MKKATKITLRAARKSAHLTSKAFHKGLSVTTRVEHKATNLLTGRQLSAKVSDHVSFEEAFFGGIRYNLNPLNPALPKLDRPAAVVLVIPSLINGGFYGGVATALIFAGKLAVSLNRPLRIVQTLAPGDGKGLSDFWKLYNGPVKDADIEVLDVSMRRFNFYGYIDMHADDIFVASAWWDAKLVSDLPRKHPFVYLIQDYEPIFYANGDHALLAEQTYHTNDFVPVCNTELMKTFMTSRGYEHIAQNGLFFEPAVSRADSGLVAKPGKKRKMFLYGRPSVERNLFYSGLLALEQLFSDGELSAGDWDVVMAGQSDLPDIVLSSGVRIVNKGKMSMEEYISFSKDIDLAISLMMAPHPNYPTLEFASIGSAVVTTRWETKQDLSRYSKNIVMADLNITSLKHAIKQAADLDYDTRMRNVQHNNILQSWDESLDATLRHVVDRLHVA